MPVRIPFWTRLSRTFHYYRLHLKFRGERLLGHEFVPRHGVITIEPSGLCNLSCRFCGYPKKEHGQVVMSDEAFQSHVRQAVDVGYAHISLTSSSGELFMDKGIRSKLEFLDACPDIQSYRFFTNFVLPDRADIEWLTGLKKLPWVAISVYGHDRESFCAITRRPKTAYDRLVANFESLADLAPRGSIQFEIQIRTYRSFAWTPDDPEHADDSSLMRAMRRAVRGGGVRWVGNWDSYDSWGGMVTNQDIGVLDLELADGSDVPRYGACKFLFDDPIIFADGVVNACACRGLDRSLAIGDLKRQSLREILSPDNPVYRGILERHLRSDYPETCKDCMTYRSIYRRPRGWPYISVAEFFRRKEGRFRA